MTHTVKLSPKAVEDLQAIKDYIMKDGEAIAINQVQTILSNIKNLEQFPTLGKELQAKVKTKTDIRYITVKDLYYAFYRINDQAIEIVRVLSTKQDYIQVLNLE